MPGDTQAKVKSQAHNPKGFSLFWNLLIPAAALLVCFAALEVFARSAVSQKIFPLRSYGNYHAQFEIKWNKLEKFVKDNGGVDVILLGNSMVNTGIDPALFASEYAETTNTEPLRVFNFGVEGLTVPPMADLSRLLTETYHPGTIIYFTEMRDYLADNGDDVTQSFLANEWLKYNLGQKSLLGWAVDHSVALQRLLPLRNWPQADFLDVYLQNLRRFDNTRSNGYEPEIQIVDFSGALPDASNPADQKLFDLYGNYTVSPERLDYLQKIIGLSSDGPIVFITEFPAYPGFYTYFGGTQVHAAYLAQISEFIAAQRGIFLAPIDPNLIPLNGRSDDHHLNVNGAKLYSALLGKQLGHFCLEQGRCLKGN